MRAEDDGSDNVGSDQEIEDTKPRRQHKRSRLGEAEQLTFAGPIAFKTWVSQEEAASRKVYKVLHSSKHVFSFGCHDDSCNAGGFIAAAKQNEPNFGEWKLTSFQREHKADCKGRVFGKETVPDVQPKAPKSENPWANRVRKPGVKLSPQLDVVKTLITEHSWRKLKAPAIVKLLKSECSLDCDVKQVQRAQKSLNESEGAPGPHKSTTIPVPLIPVDKSGAYNRIVSHFRHRITDGESVETLLEG